MYRQKEALWNPRPTESIPRAGTRPQAHAPASCWAPRHAQESSGTHAVNEGPGTTVLLSFTSKRAASNPDLTLFDRPNDAAHICLVTLCCWSKLPSSTRSNRAVVNLLSLITVSRMLDFAFLAFWLEGCLFYLSSHTACRGKHLFLDYLPRNWVNYQLRPWFYFGQCAHFHMQLPRMMKN